jgi:subtilisin-like proprotein convertase family protein
VNASSPWQMAVDGGLGGVITGSTTGTLVLINTPSTLNGYQVRAIATNPCSAPDFTTPPTTLIMGPLVARVTPTSATICRGTLQQLSLASPQITACSGTLNLNVPDNTPNGINNTINVSGIPGAATITRIDVTINMTHTWDGDMTFVLKAPNGQILNLDWYLSGTGGAGATTGFVNTTFSSAGTAFVGTGSNPYTGTWRADAVLAGTPQTGPNGFLPTTTAWSSLYSIPNGNWTLAMYDGGPADLGVLQNWCITISFGAPISGVWSQSPIPAGGTYANMWTNSAGTVAYTGGAASTIWVNPTSNTVYTVVASTTSPACTSAPTQIPVNVIQPLVSVTAPTTQTVCTGGTTSFSVTALSAGGAPYNGPFTYQWQESRDNGLTWQNVSNGGVYSGATTNTLTLTGVTRSAPSDMNLYRYRVTVSAPPCAGSTTTASAILNVLALPTVTITASDLALTPGQTSVITGTSSPAPASATSWSWTLNGSTIAGANTNSVTADINKLGVYRATVTDINGCRNSSNSVLIESEVSDRLWIYPNPTTGQFQVRWYYTGAYTEIRRVRIFNQAGQQILSQDFPISNVTPHYLQMNFNLSNVAGGVYVVKLYDLYDKAHVQGLLIKQ